MAIDDKDRLAFLTAYLVQTRSEIMGDKDSLGRFFVAKAAVAVSLVAALEFGLFDFVLALSPFLVMTVDFLYRKRLNEIFARWEHLDSRIVPRIEALGGTVAGDGSPWFEAKVWALRDTIYHEERLLKSVLLFPLVVFAPWAAASTILTERALPPVAAQIGAVVLAALLAAFYHYLFVQEDARREDPEARPRFRDTYFERGFWIFAILGAALGSMAVQLGWIAPAA